MRLKNKICEVLRYHTINLNIKHKDTVEKNEQDFR